MQVTTGAAASPEGLTGSELHPSLLTWLLAKVSFFKLFVPGPHSSLAGHPQFLDRWLLHQGEYAPGQIGNASRVDIPVLRSLILAV